MKVRCYFQGVDLTPKKELKEKVQNHLIFGVKFTPVVFSVKFTPISYGK